MSLIREIWLKTAFSEFAQHGESALRIDTLSRLVGKSRSSFYHLFVDMEHFLDTLIQYDLDVTQRFAEEAKDIENLVPDYIRHVVKYRDMTFFNRHLFLKRNLNKKYADAWDKVSVGADRKTEALWMKMLGLEDLPPDQKTDFYKTIRTSAMMRLEYNDFNYESIFRVVEDIHRSIEKARNRE